MSTESPTFSEKLEIAIESILRHLEVQNETEAVDYLALQLKRSNRQIRRWMNEGKSPDNPHVILKKLDAVMSKITKSESNLSPINVAPESIEKKVDRLEREILELKKQLEQLRSGGIGKLFLENVTVGKAHVENFITPPPPPTVIGKNG